MHFSAACQNSESTLPRSTSKISSAPSRKMLSDLFLFLFTVQCLLVGLMMLAGPPHCIKVSNVTSTTALSQLQTPAAILDTGTMTKPEEEQVDFNCELSCCALSGLTEPRTNVTMLSKEAQASASCEASSS